MSINKIWHFVDYPTSEDEVLLKTVDGELAICVWNQEHSRWLDVGRVVFAGRIRPVRCTGKERIYDSEGLCL